MAFQNTNAYPEAQTIDVYKSNEEGKYYIDKTYTTIDILAVGIFSGLEIPVIEIFNE